MRLKHKKAYISGIAVTLAGVLGIGALLQSGISVQASPAMMPGIEQIIKEKGNKEPFRILEIVDDKKDAEIGWYVSGQEPYIKLYEYTTSDSQTIRFSTLEEGLGKLPSDKLRKEFANNIKLDENGTIIPDGGTVKDVTSLCFKDNASSTNPLEEYPLSYKEYTEKYFLSPEDKEEDWKRMDFVTLDGINKRTDKVPLHGKYVPNSAGTGDYTKEPQKYYPIRQDTEDKNKPEKYRENIKDFFYLEGTGATAPYQLEFAEVKNETVNEVFSQKPVASNNVVYREYDHTAGRYGYYERVYADLTKELSENTTKYPGEKATIEKEGSFIRENPPLSAAELFSAGDDTPFSSNEVQTAKEEPIIEEEPFAENAFSDGNSAGAFSSEDVAEELPQSEEMSIPERDPVMAAPPIETTVPGCIHSPLGKEYAGTQSDPWVYLGELIDQFPNYKYTRISDLERVKAMAAKKAEEDKKNLAEGKPIVRKEGDISLEHDQYFYWKSNAEGEIEKHSLSIVTGYQPVAYKDIRPLAENLGYDYYFRVEKVYFCCELSPNGDKKNPEAYQYFGWYYPSFPQSEEQYLPIKDPEIPTHYISEAEYKLTEGVGDYDFVPGDGEGTKEHLVEVNHMFYQGGYTNHDWLKKYVFHLEKTPNNSSNEGAAEEKPTEWEQFAIEVTTMLPGELDQTYGTQTVQQDSIEEEPSAAEAFTDQEAFIDAEENTSETVPVEPMISESQENLEPAELFTDNGQTEEPAFTSGVEATAQTAWEAFDLIYVNGNLLPSLADTLAKSGVPCIINERILQPTEGKESAVKTAFAGFIKENDVDSHYVTEYVYVFKNTLAPAGSPVDSSRLLNLQFHKNFNPDAEEGGAAGSKEAVEGFEEILEYIEKENQYRQIGDTDTSGATATGFTDGAQTTDQDSSLTDGAIKGKIPLLDKKLSHARAIEYIINYKHKRTITPKKEINVLEIQPAKSNGQVRKEEVLKWLGYELEHVEGTKPKEENIEVCCNSDNSEKQYMIDGDPNTRWHSYWKKGNPSHGNTNHVITITYDAPSTFQGIQYLPIKDKKTGVTETFKIRYYKKNQDTPFKEDEETSWTAHAGGYEYYIPEEPVREVEKIEFEVCKATGSPNNQGAKYTTCAELRLEKRDLSYLPRVNITTMTSSEFVGHIEDVNTKYDMIYFGDDDTKLNLYSNFRPEGYLYYHIGKSVRAEGELQGLMDQDYEEDGITASKLEGDVGLVRGSGNDITAQQQKGLMDFVRSGYPVVLGDSLLDESGSINEKKVDNSSYIHLFLQDAIKYQNVMTRKAASKNSNLSFYMEIPKPKIVFGKDGVPVSAIKDIHGPSGNYMKGDGLSFSFHIEDNAAVSPASTLYNCELYLDLNCDGNFSKTKERIKDIQIRQNGNLLSRNANGFYELKAGKNNVYTVTRTIPQEYVKLITWKLEISNTQNTYIRTSEQGYTKRQRNTMSKVPEIKVLQIRPTKNGIDQPNSAGDGGNTWDLTDKDFIQYFQVVKDEFEITIKAITIDDYNNKYDSLTNELKGFEGAGYNNLDDYDMLIIGFGDAFAYGNINEKGVQGIENFIKTGKSVIFAHDTTSSSVGKRDAKDPHKIGMWTAGWAYNLNMKLRPIMGMDRYGITGSQKTPDKSQEISNILKKAKVLTSTDAHNWDMIKSSVPDMAYSLGANRTTAEGQTHGFTNDKMRIATKGNKGNPDKQDKVTKVNEGAITKYPYKIDDMPGFKVASTHAQYYQAALEADTDQDECNDLVVWYCLDGGTYADSPNDVRNNYYIYSNKNVFYTGVGHRLVKEKGSDEEKKLFVNTIVAAYRASAVTPKIEFVENYSMDAPEQEVAYYMTDQESFQKEPGNIINESQEFYFRVKDNNLISTGLEADGERKMDIELYITDPAGTEIQGINEKVSRLNTPIEQKTSDGAIPVEKVSSGNVYRFALTDIYKYLMDATNHYRNDVKIYAKVSTKYLYFGEEITASAVDEIELRQRHLFDLD